MRRFGFGVNSAEVARAGSAVFQGVAVQQFAPVAARGHAHAITKARKWDPLESTCRHASLSIL